MAMPVMAMSVTVSMTVVVAVIVVIVIMTVIVIMVMIVAMVVLVISYHSLAFSCFQELNRLRRKVNNWLEIKNFAGNIRINTIFTAVAAKKTVF
ncbi:MAG: hypothetical protein ACD_39C01774G0002 [uncultured bacterium]|nr:MAG: hypothetical protein ACD_39C01774G0002 [uncultured bacterium]